MHCIEHKMNNKHKKQHKRALDLFNARRLKEAFDEYRKLCNRNDHDIQAWHMAGAIAGMLGDYTAAKSCCEKVIALNPGIHGPYLNLANVLMATGQYSEALQNFQQALRIKPGDPQTLTNLASLYAQQGQSETAIDCLEQVIRSNPEYPEACNNLGNLYRDMGRLGEAEFNFRKALDSRPDYVDALCNLGAVLSDQLKYDDAEACYRMALRYAPDDSSVLRNLGDLYQSTGDFDQARRCYQRSLEQAPDDVDTRSSLATLYERCGSKEEALELLDPIIDARQYNADSAITYARLCRSKGTLGSAIGVLTDALKRPFGENKSIDLYFSLGELYDWDGQYDAAFNSFKTANDMDAARQSVGSGVANLTPISEYFSKKHLDSLPRSTCKSEMPVFIVGMPRTGTSLVEQILASHSLVSAGGEREDIFTMIESLGSATAGSAVFPQILETISTEDLDSIANKHLEDIGPLVNDSVRFTDKTPLHGMHLGFISRLFSGCRVIICNRNAFDTCLSIYFHRFNAFHGYANSLEGLGSFYREYYQLMRHWVDVLDIKLMSVQYEELVRQPEEHIRRIIGFCGLGWENSCLEFYKNKRTVNTPSYDQVRRPMYTNSIGRWKNYEQYLGPLKTALDD